MTKPYEPSNGTEGMQFTSFYCDRCSREEKYERTQDGKDACRLLSASLVFRKTDPEYPEEWIQEDDGSNPRYTAFILRESKMAEDERIRHEKALLEKHGQQRLI